MKIDTAKILVGVISLKLFMGIGPISTGDIHDREGHPSPRQEFQETIRDRDLAEFNLQVNENASQTKVKAARLEIRVSVANQEAQQFGNHRPQSLR